MSRLDFFGTLCYYVLIRKQKTLIDVCVRLKGQYMDTLLERLTAIKSIFNQHDIEWVEPFETTLGAINNKEVDTKFRGLYYFYENNFYVGIASRGKIKDRHDTHRPKFDVDLKSLWRSSWAFSEAWQEGVRKYIIEDTGDIPFKKRPKGTDVNGYYPEVNFPVKHKVDVEKIKVLIWNLDHLKPWQIKMLETFIIYTIWPYCNDETYDRRKSEQEEEFTWYGS